jgi:sigma-B regulation protein RsbU (phosphoserine phosphatase)
MRRPAAECPSGKVGTEHASVIRLKGAAMKSNRRGLRKKAAGYRALQQEMQRIAALQHHLMPRQPPHLKGWDIAISYLVNHSPGGDYYDFFPRADDRRLALVVADASGHGGAAAITVAQVRTFLHSCPLTCGHSFSPFCTVKACAFPPPGVILAHLSRLLEENTLSDHFMTAYYGVLAPDTGTFLYANAGHPPPRWWRAALGTVEAVPDGAGPPLGIGLADTYSEASIRLDPGDVLVFFTDGLIEARSRLHGAFGVGRLDAAIREGVADGAEAVKGKVMDSWQEFTGGKPCEDDVTLVVLARAR